MKGNENQNQLVGREFIAMSERALAKNSRFKNRRDVSGPGCRPADDVVEMKEASFSQRQVSFSERNVIARNFKSKSKKADCLLGGQSECGD